MNRLVLSKQNIGGMLSLVMFVNLILVLCFDNYSFVVSVFVLGFLRIIHDDFDFLKPSSGFLFPWILLFIFINLDITIYTRPIDVMTLKLMCLPVSLCVIISSEYFYLKVKDESNTPLSLIESRYNLFLLLGLFLFLVNAIASGFLPLINAILTGDSNYLEYGVKGLNGMFYAYANALCLLSYVLFLDTSNKKYLFHFGAILFIFLLCLTRQNLISAFVEVFIVHSLKRGNIPKKKLLIYVGIMLVAFGALGELRSGDIKGIMGLRTNFYWLPNSFIWVYSYGFFNVLNLDNLVTSKAIGLFDMSSVSSLLPSILRPKYEDTIDQLEVVNFNISSYLNPVLKDLGFKGVVVFTTVVVFLTALSYKFVKNYPSFKSISIYSVMLFCALFSFFINFWFYLPIIFQIPFLLMFNHYVFRSEKN
jgi:oligosaccharide repeat unit polymerase